MSSMIQKVSTVSVSKVVFSELKKQGKGGFLSFVNYKDGDKSQRLILQIPKMFAALMLLSLLGVVLFFLLSLLEHFALRKWHESVRQKNG